MIGELEGTRVWVVLMTTTEMGDGTAAVTSTTVALAVVPSERMALEIRYQLRPDVPRDASLTIDEVVMMEP